MNEVNGACITWKLKRRVPDCKENKDLTTMLTVF